MSELGDAIEPEIVALPSAPEPVPEEPPPGVVDLLARSARLGVDVVGLVAGELASASARLARNVLPPAVAEKPLETVGEKVDRRVETAREREEVSREDALDAAQAVLNQTIGAILDMLDWDMLIQKIPAERLVANIDLGGIVRESTTSLAGETVDAVRVGMMGVDLWVARVVDRVLRRKQPRDLVVAGYDVNAPEVRVGMMGVDLWVARVVDKVLRRKHPRDLVVEGYDVNAPEVRLPKALL